MQRRRARPAAVGATARASASPPTGRSASTGSGSSAPGGATGQRRPLDAEPAAGRERRRRSSRPPGGRRRRRSTARPRPSSRRSRRPTPNADLVGAGDRDPARRRRHARSRRTARCSSRAARRRSGSPPRRPSGTTVTVRLVARTPTGRASSTRSAAGPCSSATGKPVFRHTSSSRRRSSPRNPRTAVGQRADGRILLVVVDGRQPGYSVGMTNFELAQTLVRLGRRHRHRRSTPAARRRWPSTGRC